MSCKSTYFISNIRKYFTKRQSVMLKKLDKSQYLYSSSPSVIPNIINGIFIKFMHMSFTIVIFYHINIMFLLLQMFLWLVFFLHMPIWVHLDYLVTLTLLNELFALAPHASLHQTKFLFLSFTQHCCCCLIHCFF